MLPDQVRLQFPQRPTPIGQPHNRRCVIGQPHQDRDLPGADPGRHPTAAQLLDSRQPSLLKRMQVRVDRIRMRALRRRYLQRAQPQAVQQQGFSATRLMSEGQLACQFVQLSNLSGCWAANFHLTSHGITS